ncbi:cation transporter [Fontibacter flavus]|uniref:Cation transporter n=1 Tax=Fontibacter flavus TaxID=654838 RepID=A0ABV6FN06_9BACT
MQKTTFHIAKMDCPSEEQMIRMKLSNLEDIKALEFDIPNRKLQVFHLGHSTEILSMLSTLQLDTTQIESISVEPRTLSQSDGRERKILWAVLAINFAFFLIEMITGLISKSMGLVADSLDMLADSIVYALALYAVGGTIAKKKNIAAFAGYFQILLAVLGFAEVIRRFLGVEKMPDFSMMIIISILALIANVICLYLLQKGKSKEAHMQASMIFTSNDIIINGGVILAGILVLWTGSTYPDLIIGGIVFLIVARGAYRILQLSK